MVKILPADKYFSWWLRSDRNWTCERCGTKYEPPTKALHASHYVGRGKWNTRFDPENVHAHCYGCHRYFTSNPGEHAEWIDKQYFEGFAEELKRRGRKYKKRDKDGARDEWRERLKEDFPDIYRRMK